MAKDLGVYEGADVMDSRNVIEQTKLLEMEREEINERLVAAEAALTSIKDAIALGTVKEDDLAALEADSTVDHVQAELEEWDEDEDRGGELAKLTDLAVDGSRSPDWTHGETLISDAFFRDYAMELAEDIGAINKDIGWPMSHIDWDAAADALKQDYMSVEYGSTTYWIRA